MLLHALDRARGLLLRRVVVMPFVGPAVRRREPRIALRLAAAIAFAFILTAAAPAATLAVSPLLLGVPHVASSIRYLVLRQALPRAWIGVLGVGALGMAALRFAEQYAGSPHAMARGEVALGVALAIAAACFAARRTGRRARRRLLAALPALGCLGVALVLHPTAARLLFVHVHNLGAVAVWALVMQRGRAAAPLFMLGGALAALLGGAVVPLQPRALGVDVEVVGRWLVPGAAAAVAVPLVLAHVFTDSLHYAFWLGIIPDETRRTEGTPTFSMTWRALVRDFGRVGLALVIAAFAAFLALAVFGATRARDAYFAIAGFHGYVEGAMLVYLLVCGRRAEPSTSS